MSVRSVERVTSVHRDTILRLLVLAGERCQRLMDERIKDLNVRDVEVDEIWGYVFKKEGHKWEHEKDNERNRRRLLLCGDGAQHKARAHSLPGQADSRIHRSIHFQLGARHSPLRRYQLTSDGFAPYKPAVKSFLRGRVDFAQLVKVYASSREGEQRYSPAEVVDAVPEKVMGNPDSGPHLHELYRKTESQLAWGCGA